MRVGVIRNDLSAPILLADLEQVSRRNVSVDAPGQERYISYPTVAAVEAALADEDTGAGATLSSANISGSFPLTINGTNDVLRLKNAASAAFVAYTIAHAAYATLDDLIDALNTALGPTYRAFNWSAGLYAIESTEHGVNSYIRNDTVVNGSTANTILGLTNGSTRTMVSAATLFTAVGLPGALNVSSAALGGAGAGTAANALAPYFSDGVDLGVVDVFAKQFAETDNAMESFLVGNISELRNASFNPDSRNPASVTGAAVAVREDDGSTNFATANTLPTITTADLGTPSAGYLTITGKGLGKESGNTTDPLRSTRVKLTGAVSFKLSQEVIEAAGGTVSDTSIVIPPSLIPGAVITTTSAQVQFRQRVSAVVVLT